MESRQESSFLKPQMSVISMNLEASSPPPSLLFNVWTLPSNIADFVSHVAGGDLAPVSRSLCVLCPSPAREGFEMFGRNEGFNYWRDEN